MSVERGVPAQPDVATVGRRFPAANDEGRLVGRMGTTDLVFAVLSYAAPLTVVSGFLPFIIIFDGPGAPAAYAAATVLLLLLVVGLAAMSRHLSNPGAFYSYVTAGLGRIPGLGAAFLAVYSYVLIAVSTYAFFGIVANALVKDVLGGPDISWYWYELAALALVALFGFLNISLSAKVLAVTLTLEVIIVMIFNVAVGVQGGADGLSLSPLGWHAFSGGTVGVAVIFSVFCFLGFESTAIYREEAKDPDRTIPRAMYLSVSLIGVFYVVSALMLVLAYGPESATKVATNSTATMFPDAVRQYLSPFFVDVTALLLVSSVFAVLLASQNMISRYLFSLGRDGVLPHRIGVAHPRHGAPSYASAVVSMVSLVEVVPFVVADSDPALLYGRMAGVGAFSIVTLMLLATVAILAFFRSRRHLEVSVGQTTIAPGAAAIGLLVILYLSIKNFSTLTNITGWAGVVVVMMTFVVLGSGMVYAAVLRLRKPQVFERIGRQ